MYRLIDGNGIEYNDDFINVNTINSLIAYIGNNIHNAIEYVGFHKKD